MLSGRPLRRYWSLSRPLRLFLLGLLAFSLMPRPGQTAPPTIAPLPPVQPGSDFLGLVNAYEIGDLATTAGARWERVLFFWNTIQPDRPDQWEPNGPISDAQIEAERRRGRRLVGLIGNPPAWATRNGSVPKNLDRPLDDPENYWARFVERLVRQYAGRIDDWIIWNEPDVDPEYPWSTWGGREDEYYQLLKVAWQAARRANPQARIIFAGTTYWVDVLERRKLFLERVLEVATWLDPAGREKGFYFDAVALHLYGSVEQFYTVPRAYREVLERYGLEKPIWIVEANAVPWDDPEARVPRGGFRATLEEQAAFVIQAVALARAAGVERLAIYKARDGLIQNGEPYGLVRNDGSLRPAFRAFQVAAAYLSLPGTVTYRREGAVDWVTITQPTRRVHVLWTMQPAPASAAFQPVGTRLWRLWKDGQRERLALPTDRLDFTVTLPPATANTDDHDPNRYIIGGDPVILVEEGIGEALVGNGVLYYPVTGFAIRGDFLEYFQRRGGLRTFGYPLSRPFRLLGTDVQVFQRRIMQRQPDGRIGLLNVLDPDLLPLTRVNGAVLPPVDPVLTRQAPAPGTPGYAAGVLAFVQANVPDLWEGLPVNFGTVYRTTVRLEEVFPDGRGEAALLPGFNLELWGLPTSRPQRDPHNHDFVYQRFQRGIMHYDRRSGQTQGLLVAEYFKALLTGEGLPPDLEAEFRESRFYRQYDPQRPAGLRRPDRLPATDLRGAFEREPAPVGAR